MIWRPNWSLVNGSLMWDEEYGMMYGRFGQEHSHVQGARCGEGSSATYWPVLVMQRASTLIPDIKDLREEVAGENKKTFNLLVTNDLRLSFYSATITKCQ